MPIDPNVPCNAEGREHASWVSCGGEVARRVVVCDPAAVGATFNNYSEIVNVTPTTETIIITKTVGALETAILHHVEASSDSISTIRLKVGGTTIAKKRIGFGGSYNVNFPFDGHVIPAGSVITVTGENCSDVNAEFDARINGRDGSA